MILERSLKPTLSAMATVESVFPWMARRTASSQSFRSRSTSGRSSRSGDTVSGERIDLDTATSGLSFGGGVRVLGKNNGCGRELCGRFHFCLRIVAGEGADVKKRFNHEGTRKKTRWR